MKDLEIIVLASLESVTFYILGDFKKLFVVKMTEKETHTPREIQMYRDSSHLLVHSPDACNGWGWAGAKARA